MVKKYERKFVDTHEIPALWLCEQRRKGRGIKDVSTEHYNTGGQLGIVYHECVSALPENETRDFERFILDKSPYGFTARGQNFLQQAIESFVYSVLGAQARTRWSIVDEGARSLQTQDVFYKLVADTILKNDPTQSIADMQKAISDTNVVLNLVVSPGVILLPSDLKIVKQRVAGWNNILTTATSQMSFGKNTSVNNPEKTNSSRDEKKNSTTKNETTTSSKLPDSNVQHNDKVAFTGSLGYITSGVLIALLTRLAIFLL